MRALSRGGRGGELPARAQARGEGEHSGRCGEEEEEGDGQGCEGWDGLCELGVVDRAGVGVAQRLQHGAVRAVVVRASLITGSRTDEQRSASATGRLGGTVRPARLAALSLAAHFNSSLHSTAMLHTYQRCE